MTSKLFAFTVSKEVDNSKILNLNLTYNDAEQVGVWTGEDTVNAAAYCTSVPYQGYTCYFISAICHHQQYPPSSANKKCDVV